MVKQKISRLSQLLAATAVNIGDYFESPFGKSRSVGDLVSLILQIAFVIAGLMVIFLIIFAGYAMLLGAGNSDPQQTAKSRQAATAAVIGFIVIFVAYWIVRLIEEIIGQQFITNLTI